MSCAAKSCSTSGFDIASSAARISDKLPCIRYRCSGIMGSLSAVMTTRRFGGGRLNTTSKVPMTSGSLRRGHRPGPAPGHRRPGSPPRPARRSHLRQRATRVGRGRGRQETVVLQGELHQRPEPRLPVVPRIQRHPHHPCDRARDHWLTSTVLPEPGPAEIRVTGRWTASSSISSSRGRCTSLTWSRGGTSFRL